MNHSTLPTGTITFLFTDIEGSTRLWQEHPERMKLNLARHDQILRDCIERNQGHVFKTVGDAFCAAFPTALQGIMAALDAQQELSRTDWGECVLKVRMGLHSGDAEQREEDYFGTTLNRTARLMSAGHGGQILLSLVTHELVSDKLPNGTSLINMGVRRLKDLIQPEQIFQLKISGLSSDFPPLRTLEKYRHNLPLQTTNFIGREKEVTEIRQSLKNFRLVTLTGSGGTGKTRLSLQVAADLLEFFTDGVWFVELAPITVPEVIPQTILAALNTQSEQDRSPLESLLDFLHKKTTLLVLDNCEHLIAACASLVDTLLASTPDLKILATSREALGARGEMAWRVPSFSIPELKKLPPLGQLSQYEAVRLFVERAQMVQKNFTLTASNATPVAQVCSRLDGIPLAIELAAMRVKVLSVEQIATRLDDRFRLLTGGARTALPRQQTLRALIDWSYDLLSEQEKILLRRLSVFMGSWSMEIAEQVCTDERLDALDVLDILAKLIDKSLVVMLEGGTQARYRMLETVRQYAREKLYESGEGEKVRDQHLKAFITLAELAEPEIRASNQLIWMDRLDDEIDNLRTALEWSQVRDPESFLRLASAAWRFWSLRGYTLDMEWLPSALAATKGMENQLVARALARAGFMAFNHGDNQGARIWSQTAEEMCRKTGEKHGLVMALETLGELAPDPVQGMELLDEALTLVKEINDHWEWSGILNSRASIFLGKNDLATARSHFEKALMEARLSGDKRRVCFGLEYLGYISLCQSAPDQAESYYREAFTEAQIVKDHNHMCGSYWFLTLIKIIQDEPSQALEMIPQNFQLSQNDRLETSQVYLLSAWIDILEDNPGGAIEQLEQGLLIARDTTNVSWINLLINLGDAYRRKKAFQKASNIYAEAAGIFQSNQMGYGDIVCLEGLGMLAIDRGKMAKGIQLLSVREKLRTNVNLMDFAPFMIRERETHIATACNQLGQNLFDQAWEKGRALEAKEALQYGLDEAYED